MKNSRFNPLFVVSLLASSFAGNAYGINYQWDVNSSAAGLGGTGTWNSTNAFWDSTASGANDGTEVTTAPTFTASDTAIFGGTAGNVTVDAVTVGGLNFTSSGYNLSGGTIILGANTTILQTTSSANTTTISSKISGAFKLTTNATSYSQYANLTLSGANDYSGGTDLNHNTIVTIGNAAAFGTGTITVNGFFGQLRASSGLTIANNIVLNNDWGLYGSNNVTTNGTLNLGGGAPRTITVDTGRTFVIGGNTSNGGLTKAGSGILRLTNSSYAGATTVSAGTLRIRNTSSSSGFSIASGANLELTNLSLTSSQNITGSGNVSTDVSLFGAVTLNGTNNNYTGTTTVTIDRLRLGAGGVINGTSGITVQGQWSSRFENFGTVTTPGAVTLNGYAGSGTASEAGIFFNGNLAGSTPGSLTATSITLGSSFRSAAASPAKGGEFLNYTGSTVSLGSGAITVNGQGNSLAGGMVSAGSQFSNAGTVTAGSLTLNSSSTANTASNKGGTYSQTAGSTTLSGTATLAANGGTGAVGTAGNDAAFNLSGGTFSAVTLAVNSGTVTATGGNLNLGSGGITKTGTVTTAINLGATTLGATAAWNSFVAMSLTDSITGTTVNTTGGHIGLSGELSGTGNLVKSGTGTLTLSGTNSYTGATSVDGGVLAVSGSLAATAVTVQSGGTFDLSGTVGGDVTVNSGGTLKGSNGLFNASVTINGLHAPGASPGLQTFASGLNYGSTATLNAEFVGDDLGVRGTDFDAINVTGGNLSIDLASVFKLIGTSINYTTGLWDSNRSFTVIDFTSAGSSTGVFSLDTSLAGSFAGEGSWALANTSGDVVLNWTAVPEPASALLGGIGLLFLLRRRR